MGATRRSDALLAGHPWSAFYWPLMAASFYAFVSASLITFLAPQLFDVLGAEGTAHIREKWIYSTLLQALILIRMCLWVQKINGEPFGAPVRADMSWFLFAVLAVPVIHYLTFDLIGMLFSSGEVGWTVREDFDTSMFEADRYSLMLLYVVILAPIVEEVGFRGILLGFLRGRGVHAGMAVLVTAAGFALLHTQYTPPAIAAVFVLGVVLGWLRLTSNSIGPPIIAHMAVNAVQTL